MHKRGSINAGYIVKEMKLKEHWKRRLQSLQEAKKAQEEKTSGEVKN